MASKTKAKTPAAKLAAGTETKTVKAGNVFTEVASHVENLTEKKAFEQVDQLVDDIESNSFKLGGILSVIQSKGWFGDYDDFKTLVNERFSLHYRKAAYLINIYNNLVEKQIPWSQVKDLGWTKLKELAPILTQKNAEGWVAKAEKMTVLQLIEAVAKTKGGSSDKSPSTVTTRTFKLHKDQKQAVDKAVDKGKKEFETDADSVALANICSGYLGGTVTVEVEKKEPKEMSDKEKKALLSDLMKEAGWKVVLNLVDKLFDEEIDVSVTPK